MTQAEQIRLREFSQRMRDEGTAGFADGPWDETDMEDDPELSARQRQKQRWGMHALRSRRQRTFSDRVLTWAAILALITLVAGIAGAWLSYQPEPVTSVTTPYRLHQTPGLDRIESRLTRMEKRLSHILDPYIRTLNNLGGAQQQLTRQVDNIEKKQATTATGFDERLENIEQRMQITDERLDTLSAALVALVDGKAGPLPGSEQPATSTTQITPAPAQVDTVVRAEQQSIATDLVDSPPDTTAGPAATVIEPAPVTKQEIPASVPTGPAGSRPEAGRMPGDATPLAVPATTQESTAPVAATATKTRGNWAINIASYANENIARRKLAQMQQQGVDAELVPAEVNGKPIYRARVLGFTSRRAAGSAAKEIKSKLGIGEVWITKR